MELTIAYIVSQIFVIINRVLLIVSYQLKNRKNILIVSLLALLANGVVYILLSAWSGLAMVFVAIVRNIIFMLDEKKNGKSQKITKRDVGILVVLYVISIISAIFTYEGILSMMSVVATMLYTYSVWQKKTKVYKILGIIIESVWIIYNIYICSIMGVILNISLLISASIGLNREYKMISNKNFKNK